MKTYQRDALVADIIFLIAVERKAAAEARLCKPFKGVADAFKPSRTIVSLRFGFPKRGKQIAAIFHIALHYHSA